MIEKITVKWIVESQGEMEISPIDVGGMSPSEIEDWVLDGVVLELTEQGNYSVRLEGFERAVEQIAEALKDAQDEETP